MTKRGRGGMRKGARAVSPHRALRLRTRRGIVASTATALLGCAASAGSDVTIPVSDKDTAFPLKACQSGRPERTCAAS